MTLKINSNAGYLTLNRLLGNDTSTADSLARLASGLRITKASDDASGMTIANSLRSQSMGFGQSIRNASDAVSIAQVADSALGEVTSIIEGIRTKALQASNASQDTTSRQALQSEINRSLAALNDITKNTSFNGQKLLSGAFSNKSFQIGPGPNDVVTFSIPSVDTENLGGSGGALATENIAKDSVLKAQTVLKAGSSLGFTLDDTNLNGAITTTKDSALTAGSVLGAGSVIAQGSKLGGTVDVANTTTTKADSQLTIGSVLETGTELAAGTRVTTQFTAGGQTYSVGQTLGSDVTLTGQVTLMADMTVKAGSSLTGGSSLATGSKVGADVTIAGAATMASDMTLAAGSVISDGQGTALQAGSVVGGDITLAVDVTVQQDMTLISDSSVPQLADIDVTTTEGAQNAVTAADAALAQINSVRADIGSTQNQLFSSINSLANTNVNIQASLSSIADVDYAEEASVLSKMKVLNAVRVFALAQSGKLNTTGFMTLLNKG